MESPYIEDFPRGGFRIPPPSSVFTLGVPFRVDLGYPPRGASALWVPHRVALECPLLCGFPMGCLWDPPCSVGSPSVALGSPLLWGFPSGHFCVPAAVLSALGAPSGILWFLLDLGTPLGMGLRFPPCCGMPPAVFWVPQAALPLWGLPLCCRGAGLSPPQRDPGRDPRTRRRTR